MFESYISAIFRDMSHISLNISASFFQWYLQQGEFKEILLK